MTFVSESRGTGERTSEIELINRFGSRFASVILAVHTKKDSAGTLEFCWRMAINGSSSSKRKVEAQREGESSSKKLNVTVGLETLDCTICSAPLRPPIFQVLHLCACSLVFELNLLFHL